MSAKFAAVTSELLARKGEARPWEEPLRQPFVWPAPEPLSPPPKRETAPPAAEADWKRCAIRISKDDYERLGLLAVKQGSSRQHLLQQMLADFFAGVRRGYGPACACLGKQAPEV